MTATRITRLLKHRVHSLSVFSARKPHLKLGKRPFSSTLQKDNETYKVKYSPSLTEDKLSKIRPMSKLISTVDRLYHFGVIPIAYTFLKFSHYPTPFKYHPFQQEVFGEALSKTYPHLYSSPKEMCVGHTHLWHEYHLKGKNYLDELKLIETALKSNQPLSEEQLELLKNIASIQKTNSADFTLMETDIRSGISRDDRRHELIALALEEAIQKPNQLVVVVPFKINLDNSKDQRNGHVIGLCANSDGSIKYFDSSLGEYIFANAQSAQIKISELLKKYQPEYDNLNILTLAPNKNQQMTMNSP